MLTVNSKDLFTSVALRCGVIIYLAIFVRYQTDPHHDGYILGSAAAVADGRFVHTGAFSQYGPVTPWLAGFFLNITSNSVLNLRILSGILAFLTYLLIEHTLRKLEFSKNLSRLMATSWIAINHVTSTSFDGSFYLWPSLISSLFLLSSLNLILIGILKNRNKFIFLLSGSLIGLAFFTRVQSIIVVFVLVILSWVCIKEIKDVLIIGSGTLLTTLLILFYLSYVGSLQDFINQVIIRPASAYPSLGSGNNYNRFQFVLYVSLPIAFTGYLYIAKMLLAKFKERKTIAVLLIAIGTYIISYLGGSLLLSDKNAYLRLIVGDQANRIIFWPIYFCFFGTVVLAILSLLKRFRNTAVRDLKIVAVIAFGLSVTPQIFPQPDIAHLWWIAPLLIPPTLVLIRSWGVDLSQLKFPLVSILIASGIASITYSQRDWSSYTYKPLVGTFAFKKKADAVNVYKPLTEFLKKNNAVFLCDDGLHAVASGRYASIDEWFVDWGFLQNTDSETRLKSTNNIVVCDLERKELDQINEKYDLETILFTEDKFGDIYRSLAILSRNHNE